MIYRFGSHADWVHIAEYVNAKGYFVTLKPQDIGGVWLLAVDKGGKIKGTLWYFTQPPQAYIDYWTAESPIVAKKLGQFAETAFKIERVEYVRGMVAGHNTAAIRMAVGHFGMQADTTPYYVVYKEIPSGPRINTDNHNTGTKRVGAGPPPAT